ncbi:hypothetical protein [Haloferula sp. BvORR071]|uniref:hypothetical protein n=1 Tax=Haloferula sp. BvORR071 TaxID=1396141 RepID=UPI000552ACD6|nr:hypothetical protein [Haloferula sp. BvORR071]
MRTCHLLSLACLAAGSIAGQVRAEQTEMRDSLTGDQIAEMHAQAAKQYPTAVVRAKEAPDPSKEAPSEDITATSDFLSFNGRSTLVPKRAILHIPANLADRLKFTPGATLMTWGDFFAVNRAWITTVEVSRIQAEGNQALAEEVEKQVTKSTSLVVATYKTGPISVLPLKTPPPADPKADPKAAADSKTASNTATASQKKP